MQDVPLFPSHIWAESGCVTRSSADREGCEDYVAGGATVAFLLRFSGWTRFRRSVAWRLSKYERARAQRNHPRLTEACQLGPERGCFNLVTYSPCIGIDRCRRHWSSRLV